MPFRIWLGAALLLLALTAGPAASASGESPDPRALVERIVQRARAVSAELPLPVAVYTNVSLFQTLAPGGEIKRSKEKTYHVTLTHGMTSNVVIAVDGRPLTPEERVVQSEKEKKWRDAYAAGRDGGSPHRMDQIINERLFARYDLAVEREELLRQHRCWILAVRPKDSPPPEERLMDRIFNRLAGRIWVDAETAEIVRVDLKTDGPLRLWGGILGALESFQIHVDREHAGRGVWYNRHLDVSVRGRRLFTPISMRASELAGPVLLVE